MDKNEAKIKYLLEHINEGKTADELNSDFEKWYQEECIVKKFNDRIETLKAEKRNFSEFVIERGCEYDYDKVFDRHSYYMCFARSILFKDFVVLAQLKHADLSVKRRIHVDIYNRSMGGYLGSVKFDNLCEMYDTEESENLLMKYSKHYIAKRAVCKIQDCGPYSVWAYKILISDTPMPDIDQHDDKDYLRNVT